MEIHPTLTQNKKMHLLSSTPPKKKQKNIFKMQKSLLSLTLFALCVNVVSSDKDVDSSSKTVYACQGDRLRIECPQDSSSSSLHEENENVRQVIKVVRANFGRFSIAVCNDQVKNNLSVNCMAPKSLRILQSRCEGRTQCEIDSEVHIFGTDPCPDTPKYLEVHYECVDQKYDAPITPSPLQVLPPWMTSTSSTPFMDLINDLLASTTSTSTTTTSTTTEAPTTAPTESSLSSETTTKRSRVPITAAPTPVTIVEEKKMRKEEQNDSSVVEPTASNHYIHNITRFLSSSLSSTNIMDTSEAPIKIEIPVQTTTSTTTTSTTETTSTTTTTSSTTTTVVTTTTTKTSTTFRSSKPYPRSEVLITTKVTSDINGRPSKFCPPRISRTLEWPLTAEGQTVTVSCPLGTLGKAKWTCKSPEGLWENNAPDLSGCRSLWLAKIHEQLRRKISLVHLSQEMAHYAASNPLFGGDITSLVDAIGVMSEKMSVELQEIPTSDQREAIVTELVQSILKTASVMISPANAESWSDLGPARQQRRTLTFFTKTLRRAGMLLPNTVKENQEITISSPNILMSVKKVNFAHMTHLIFPSDAAKATKDWDDESTKIDIPSLVLMENMDQAGAETVFIAFKDLPSLIGYDKADNASSFVNSRVVLTSVNSRLHSPLLPEPVKAVFSHLHKDSENISDPRCVHWDDRNHGWTDSACRTTAFNETHTECDCFAFGMMALLETVTTVAEEGNVFGPSGLEILIVVIVVIAVFMIVVAAILFTAGYGRDFWRRIQYRYKWRHNKSKFPCFESKNHQQQNSRNNQLNNFYVSHQLNGDSNSNGFRNFQQNGGQINRHSVNTTPTHNSFDYYMEIPPNYNTASTRPQAGPQSACATVRRKSSALDYYLPPDMLRIYNDNNISLASSNNSPGQQQQQQGVVNGAFSNTGTPLSTPERPLLKDMTSASPSKASVQTVNSHIYVEVDNHQMQLRQQQLQQPTAGTSLRQLQPIQIPILAAESSNSSQSSGYYSTAAQNNPGNASPFRQQLLQQQQLRGIQQQQQQQRPVSALVSSQIQSSIME